MKSCIHTQDIQQNGYSHRAILEYSSMDIAKQNVYAEAQVKLLYSNISLPGPLFACHTVI